MAPPRAPGFFSAEGCALCEAMSPTTQGGAAHVVLLVHAALPQQLEEVAAPARASASRAGAADAARRVEELAEGVAEGAGEAVEQVERGGEELLVVVLPRDRVHRVRGVGHHDGLHGRAAPLGDGQGDGLHLQAAGRAGAGEALEQGQEQHVVVGGRLPALQEVRQQGGRQRAVPRAHHGAPRRRQTSRWCRT